MERETLRYLVRCLACDRAFWQDQAEALLPEHSAWERHAHAYHDTGRRCKGSGKAGHWVAQGAGAPLDQPAPDS